MSEEIFIKIINGSATEAEKSSFYQLLEDDAVLREGYYQFKNLYAISHIDNPKLSNVQHDSFERFWKRVNPVKAFGIVRFWLRYAAIFIVALALGFLIQYLIPLNEGKSGFCQAN